ncbi:hypothetical protein [Sinomicrobium weinanense]|uniref:DUF4280 domain-containing protein n=1 Tax=Sinomicrobium weinanense TaxID=2842200 RepID=A0A926Q599_9FLAO|nr:hypothetical protein [Sinomicrobium weinanense]MBC9797725.1 hypothetical protein [Sinomicrobium weinanense]MBU3123616.1 hypothetical protein [Sinomicrobium weinanense]
MSSYLPEKVYTVCTFNSATNYGKLLTNSDRRSKFTVRFKGQDKPLLTEADRKLDGQFSCKTGWSSGFGSIAFGGGIMAGMLMAATVATIPVAGWIVGGAIALACVGIGLFQLFQPKPTCSEMISFDESSWINPHAFVTFDSHAAVTKRSMISCKEGGFLLPFISESAAAEAASDIGWMNRGEIALSTVTSFIGGMAVGFTGGTAGGAGAAASKITQSVLYGTGFSLVVMQPLIALQQHSIREGYDNNNNPYYDNMTGEVSIWPPTLPLPTPLGTGVDVTDNATQMAGQIDTWDSMAGSVPGPAGPAIGMFDDINMPETTSTWNLKTPFDRFGKILDHSIKQRENLLKVSGSAQEIARLSAQIADIDKALQRARVTGSFAGKKNPYGRKVLKAIQRGAYGPEAQRIFSNRSEDGKKQKRVKGAKREKLYQNTRDVLQRNQQNQRNALRQHQSAYNNNRTNIRTHSRMAGISITGLALPFVTNYFSEKTMQIAADAAMADMGHGISIVAKQH